MRYIHPFPARMAPEIALQKIASLKKNQVVLDPMCGSGMVLAQAAKHGIRSIGYDLDPLANLISRVGATQIDEDKVRECSQLLLQQCKNQFSLNKQTPLSWIDNDEETSKFVRFWFDNQQEQQMRVLSHWLIANPMFADNEVSDLLKVAVSRLIITKEPKASLARDTAHSRPHRTITENEFDIFEELPKSLNHVLKALRSNEILADTTAHLGDARNLSLVADSSIDAIITSPPYLNAIDYMRGHRLSLVWWGYSLSKLRAIRSSSIGAERMIDKEVSVRFQHLAIELGLDGVSKKNYNMLWRYFLDLTAQSKESSRVLKPEGSALYVIGNSNIKGVHIRNSELLKTAASLAGLVVSNESTREIPNNRRYMPMMVHSDNSLSGRMRTEHVIEFAKS